MGDETFVPTTVTVATPSASLMRAPDVLEEIEDEEEGAIMPLIVAPAEFPLVGAVGAVGVLGLVGEPVKGEESFPPLHADPISIAAASPHPNILRMAILHCRGLDPAFHDGSPE
jgi:hypothetical protein